MRQFHVCVVVHIRAVTERQRFAFSLPKLLGGGVPDGGSSMKMWDVVVVSAGWVREQEEHESETERATTTALITS